MSNCIKVLYDYDLVKKCCRSKSICLKSTFYKNANRKHGKNSMCEICMIKSIKKYMKKGTQTDVSFRLLRNARRTIHQTLNGK